jgi:hypothetical protein
MAAEHPDALTRLAPNNPTAKKQNKKSKKKPKKQKNTTNKNNHNKWVDNKKIIVAGTRGRTRKNTVFHNTVKHDDS